MFHAENCVLLALNVFLCARKHCVDEVLFIQGPFYKIQGLLGKIQGLFKDLSRFFNFQGLFKGLMLFQGLFKARANHGKIFPSFDRGENKTIVALSSEF